MTEQGKDDSRSSTLPYARGQRRLARSVLITGGVLTGLAVVIAGRFWLGGPKPQTAPEPPVAQVPSPAKLDALKLKVERKQRWQAKVRPRLEVADEACRDSISASIRVVTDFVQERKGGTRDFAKAMLTLRSKWQLVKSHLPSWLWGDDNAHRRFLEQKFNNHVFSSEDMKKAVEAAVTTYSNHVDAIENELLVAVRADLADIPLDALPPDATGDTFKQEFERLVAEVTPQVAKSLKVDAARELTSGVAGVLATRIAIRVLSSVATRLGVSAGILGAGASASWATFGLSFVAAIAIDQTVGWIINWWTDPVGKVEQRVNEMLDEVCKLIVEGDGDVSGLRAELEKLDQARRHVRAEALRQLVIGE